MVKIFHIFQDFTLGGAGRAGISLAKYIEKIGSYRNEFIALRPPSQAVINKCKEHSFPVYYFNDSKQLYQKLAEADIVHIHFWNTPEMYQFLWSELPEMRVLMWCHVAGDSSPQIITDKLTQFADILVACSPYTYKCSAIQKLSAENRINKCGMAYGATDFERLKNIQKKPHSDFNIGYIGTVDFIKMHKNFISMHDKIKIPNKKIIVCGSGSAESTIKQQAMHTDTPSQFLFKGFVEDVGSVLSELDVYGYPLCENTYAAAELNIQEVMHVGIPVVTFPYGGLVDLVIDNYTGFLVRSESEYIDAIEYLFHNVIERDRISKNAQNYAKQIFGAENAAKQMNQYYEKLMVLPKSRHTFSGTLQINHLEQKSISQQLNSFSPASNGADMFIDSLGDKGEPFILNKYSGQYVELLKSDEQIAPLSNLIFPLLAHYQTIFPQDPFLNFWLAQYYHFSKNWETAIYHYFESMENGFPDHRIYVYMYQIMQAINQDSLTEKIKHLITRPEFPYKNFLHIFWTVKRGENINISFIEDFNSSPNQNSYMQDQNDGRDIQSILNRISEIGVKK